MQYIALQKNLNLKKQLNQQRLYRMNYEDTDD